VPAVPASPESPEDDASTAVDAEMQATGRALDALGPIPVPRDVLMAELVRIGGGDPWRGYLAAKPGLTRSLEGSLSPRAVMMSRLRRMEHDQTTHLVRGPRTTVSSEPAEVAEPLVCAPSGFRQLVTKLTA
jgi:hypothetical protein